MGAAAATINIKPHIVGSGANARLLYGPCDIEIHRGVDRRLYGVDVARLLPPEPPGGALAAFLVHASTDSAAATTKHMTQSDPLSLPLPVFAVSYAAKGTVGKGT